jgi:hypothetical protein
LRKYNRQGATKQTIDRKPKNNRKNADVTKGQLDQVLSNIHSDVTGELFKGLETKSEYTFDDILQLKLDGKEFIVDKILGKRTLLSLANTPAGSVTTQTYADSPFIYNPFNITNYDPTISIADNSSFNTSLLMDSGNIVDNTIYLCTADDVLNGKKTEIPDIVLIRIYFPYLRSINSIDELTSKRDELIKQNQRFVNDATVSLFKSVDLFHDMNSVKKSELKYKDAGVKYIKALLRPDFNVKFPLEVIFKLLHATEAYPLIKINPSSRQENTYRLYADKTATDGRKIPYMKKAEIFSLMKIRVCFHFVQTIFYCLRV